MWEVRCGTRPLGNPFESREEAVTKSDQVRAIMSHLYPKCQYKKLHQYHLDQEDVDSIGIHVVELGLD